MNKNLIIVLSIFITATFTHTNASIKKTTLNELMAITDPDNLRKYPKEIYQYKLIIDNNNAANFDYDFEECPTVQEKFELALLAGRSDRLEELSKGCISKCFAFFNNSKKIYADDLVNIEINTNTESKPLHIAMKIAAYHRNYLGSKHKKYREMITTIHFLTDKQANPDAVDKDLKTPLHIACELGELEGALILLDNHANPDAKDKTGKTPLDYLEQRKDVLSERDYITFTSSFSNARIKLKTQKEKKWSDDLAQIKITETPTGIFDPKAPSMRPSKIRFANEQSKSAQASQKNNSKKSRRKTQKIDADGVAIKVQAPRPSSAQAKTANPLNNNSLDLKQPKVNMEDRYLVPGLRDEVAPSEKNRRTTQPPSSQTSEQNSSNKSSLDFAQISYRQSSTTTTSLKQEPVLIIAPTETNLNASAFTTPTKLKPNAIQTQQDSKSIYTTISTAFSSVASFGRSQKVIPQDSPRNTETSTSLNSSPANQELMHQASLQVKPTLPASGKSSAKIHAL